MQTPMIDFERLQDIIPEKGSITFTIKRNADGKMGVMLKTAHATSKAPNTFEPELKEHKKATESAQEALGTVFAFTESPATLTATFEESIKKRQAAAKNLAEAIEENIRFLNTKADELRKKKAGKGTPAGSAAAPKGKEAGPKPPIKEKPGAATKEHKPEAGLFTATVEVPEGNDEPAEEETEDAA